MGLSDVRSWRELAKAEEERGVGGKESLPCPLMLLLMTHDVRAALSCLPDEIFKLFIPLLFRYDSKLKKSSGPDQCAGSQPHHSA